MTKDESVGALAIRAVDEIRLIATTCEWYLECEGVDVWETSCGNKHFFLKGEPAENNHKFCPYCGARLEVTS